MEPGSYIKHKKADWGPGKITKNIEEGKIETDFPMLGLERTKIVVGKEWLEENPKLAEEYEKLDRDETKMRELNKGVDPKIHVTDMDSFGDSLVELLNRDLVIRVQVPEHRRESFERDYKECKKRPFDYEWANPHFYTRGPGWNKWGVTFSLTFKKPFVDLPLCVKIKEEENSITIHSTPLGWHMLSLGFNIGSIHDHEEIMKNTKP